MQAKNIFSLYFQFSIKKTIINSLPTRDETCGETAYSTCVLNTIDKITQRDYACTLLFLPKKVNNYKICTRNITLQMVKKIKSALNQEKYENHCKHQKLCNTVNYELVNPRNIPNDDEEEDDEKSSMNATTTPRMQRSHEKTVSIQIVYESVIVEVIKDSYTYTFINIFSEVGGALGILAGLSCMTIIEFLTNIFKYLPEYCHVVRQKLLRSEE